MAEHLPSADPDRTSLHEPFAHLVTLAETADGTPPNLPDAPPGSPDISGYRITGEIARGGMGKVYAAHHLTLDREVAIKTLLPGANAERFVTESKITAKLPHPGIPPVYDLGELADGTPFLAMKLIRGKTLSELIKARPTPQHDLPRWVGVFEQTCQAVGFAHSRGVIHRDLKPANVMVGEFGEVQVMDWGLAREMRNGEHGVRNDDSSLPHSVLPVPHSESLTHTGAILGTPGYMAPEQARAEPLDARADVFALGATLAAILTGKPAFVGTSVMEAVLKTAAADLSDVFARLESCGADADLLALAKRCLSADRDSRPADGRAVAAEVGAYRAGVEARFRQAETDRAAAEVRATETRKRQRALTWAGGIIAGVLLAGTAVSLGQMVRAIGAEGQATAYAKTANDNAGQAERNAQEARDERDAKGVALRKEQAARTEAETNLGYANKGNEILGSVFVGLDPTINYGTVADLREVFKANLRKAVDELNGSAIGDPLVVARMQDNLGLSLLNLGELELAIQMLEKARDTRSAKLGPNNPDTLASASNLGRGYREAGKFDLALPLLGEVLRVRRATLGPDHFDTIISMDSLAVGYLAAKKLDLALPLLEEACKHAKATLGPDHPSTLTSMNNLAMGYRAAGKLDQALPLLEEVFERWKATLGPDHPCILAGMNNLALGYREANKLDLALPLYEEALKLSKAKLGLDHPDTLTLMNNLAMGYQAIGKLGLALPLFEETLKLRKAKLGRDHHDTLTVMTNLAEAYRAAGKFHLATPLHEEALKLTKAKHGPDHPDTLGRMNDLAVNYQATARLDLAVPLFEETLKLRKAKLGPDHSDTLVTLSNLAASYLAVGKLVVALPLLEDVFERRKVTLGPDHHSTLTSMNNLGEGYRVAKKFDQALPLLEDAVERRKATLGPEDLQTVVSMINLALGYQDVGKFDKALPLFEEALRVRKVKLGPDHPSTISSMDNLAVNYLAANKLDVAMPLLKEACKHAKAKLGPDHPITLTSMHNLAMGYKAADKPDQALPLFEDAFERWKAKHGPDHPTTLSSMFNLGLAYCTARKGEKAVTTLTAFVGMTRKRMPKEDLRFAALLVHVSHELLKCDQFATAEEMLRECLGIREKKEPDARTTFNAMSMLGGALLGQKKYKDAEPLLVKGYEGQMEGETTPKGGEPRIVEALDRLIELYTATEKPDELKKYKEQRAKYPAAKKEVLPPPRADK